MLTEADEVHISVIFTWDLPEAERLAKVWSVVAPVKIGGPATGQRGEVFVPGMYVRHGVVITSRGCPNKCWFCSVWRREGGLRELPICGGWDVQDDNLLACSEKHIRGVFVMLARQNRPIDFSGGMEADRLQEWHCVELSKLPLRSVYFAYDAPDDLEPLRHAGKMLRETEILTKVSMTCRCFVLVGFPKDTYAAAERRVWETMRAGFVPFIMCFRDKAGIIDEGWRSFGKRWKTTIGIKRGLCVEARKSLWDRKKQTRPIL